MTNKNSKASGGTEYNRELHDILGIEYVFEIENYTRANHEYDKTKHEEILEALHQCTIVADRMMKHAEDQGLCSILWTVFVGVGGGGGYCPCNLAATY